MDIEPRDRPGSVHQFTLPIGALVYVTDRCRDSTEADCHSRLLIPQPVSNTHARLDQDCYACCVESRGDSKRLSVIAVESYVFGSGDPRMSKYRKIYKSI